MIGSAVRQGGLEASDDVKGFGDGEVDLVRDRQLVARCQSGDAQAFKDLYLLYYKRIYRLCLKRLRNHELAADAAQETFAKAWKALSRFGNEQRFYPWLAVIAANHCTDVIRKQSRLRLVADIEDVSRRRRAESDRTEPDVQERIVESSERGHALAALGRLNPRHREVLQLREAQGLSYQAIADQQGVPVSAVETLIWRARQAFKREYQALGGGAAAGLGLLWGFVGKAGSLWLHAGRRAHAQLSRAWARAVGRAVGVTSNLSSGAPGAPTTMTASSQALGKAALVVVAMLVGLRAGLAGSGALGRGPAHSRPTHVLQSASSGQSRPSSINPAVLGSEKPTDQLASKGRLGGRGTGAGPQADTQGTQSGTAHDSSLGSGVLGGTGGAASGLSQITGGVTKGVSKVLSGATGGVGDITGGATGGLSKILSGATGKARKRFGVLFQDGALFGSMNLYDNIAFPLREHTDMGESEIRERVLSNAAMVGLLDHLHKLPGEISGGMRKRAELARAMVTNPDIVLFDEPDSGLDPVRVAYLDELVLRVQRETSTTFFIITHNISSVLRTADYIGLLFRSRLVAFGPKEEVLRSPDVVVQQFLRGNTQGPIGMEEMVDA